ncbi:MAG: PQQ-binding-like beta-propeller repeat protein [Planctomycetota bacterium]|jgi:outer membrane protein assembly factor BamB
MRLAAALLMLSAIAAGDEWLFPRGDPANTGVTKNRGPKAKPEIQWRREEEGAIGTGAALVSGRLIYGAGEFVLACRRQSDGGKVWDGKVKQSIVSRPLALGALIYFGGQDHVHYRINLSDGKEPATTVAGGPIVADPAVTEEYYLAGGTDGWFYAMSSEDGRLLWRKRTGPVHHGAVVAKGKSYVVNSTGKLYAFDIRGGKELWNAESGTEPVAAPILSKGRVLLPLIDRVDVIQAKSGTMIDRHLTKSIAGAPVLDKQLLHYGTKEGEVVTLDLKTGKEKARVKVAPDPVAAPLVCAHKILYGSAGTTLFAYEVKSRRVLWTFEHTEAFQPIAVADKCIYVGAGTAFYCLR